MNKLTNRQRQVLRKARRLVKNESWYTGVCTDQMPTDNEIKRRGSHHYAIVLALDTAAWDAPSSFK